MKSINRLEENWAPKWNLGLQDEFGFSLDVETVDGPKLKKDRPSAWSMASREVLNRQSPASNRVAKNDSSLHEVVSFLDNLSKELANDE